MTEEQEKIIENLRRESSASVKRINEREQHESVEDNPWVKLMHEWMEHPDEPYETIEEYCRRHGYVRER